MRVLGNSNKPVKKEQKKAVCGLKCSILSSQEVHLKRHKIILNISCLELILLSACTLPQCCSQQY